MKVLIWRVRAEKTQGGLTLPSCVALCAIFLPLIITACAEEPVEEKQIARPVKMMTVGAGGQLGRLEYPGEVRATQQSNMAFEVSGRIIEFRFKEGQRVKKGDVLARLDPRDFKAELERETAKRNAAKAEYERVRSLFEVDAMSRKDLDVARRNYEVTEAGVKTARKALEDSYLRAPFSGRMAKKLVEDFQNVKAKEPVLILQDDSQLELVVSVPEADWARVKQGLTPDEQASRAKPKVEVSAFPGRQMPAKVKEFTTTADPVTRTFQVTLVFDNPPDVEIHPGMTGKAIGSPRGGITEHYAIPANAVVADERGTSYVWVVDPTSMTVQRRPIELGQLSGAMVAVHGGLKSGEVIATSGVHHLREGALVRRFEDVTGKLPQ